MIHFLHNLYPKEELIGFRHSLCFMHPMVDDETTFCAISTFSGGGIGDIGVEWGAGVPVISACELIPERAGLIRYNYPSAKVFQGDIWGLKSDIIAHAKTLLRDSKPWLFIMSPPCQGMSSNGAGRISKSIAAGKRPSEDERNRLIIPGIEIVEKLKPSWFILENVKRMENTVISNENGEPENILDMLGRRLHPLGYTIRSVIVDFRDLGVPHHRQRLITIGTNIPEIVEEVQPGNIFSQSLTELHPSITHGDGQNNPHITLRDVIGDMPELDSLTKQVCDKDPYHHIPKWNKKHHFWMKHTPEGATAFENDVCPSCEAFVQDRLLVNCPECKFDLPRPTLEFVGWNCKGCGEKNRQSKLICDCGRTYSGRKFSKQRRLIRGFKTSYRRLKWDKPSSTITMNSGIISSDMKGHPEQHRVLSVREIMMLSTLQSHPAASYPWNNKYQFKSKKAENDWFYDGEMSPKLVRQVIGESIPPLAMAKIVSHLKKLDPRIP
jgi:DNA (cytosine-5)-methyltransferase 1